MTILDSAVKCLVRNMPPVSFTVSILIRTKLSLSNEGKQDLNANAASMAHAIEMAANGFLHSHSLPFQYSQFQWLLPTR